jgi:hypothetical protein
MLTVLLIPLSVLLILVGGLWFFSPGRSSSIVDEGGRPVVGSLSEQIRVTINGVEQGMFIRGRDATKPVLLFVHGGAGMPEYFLFQKYSTTREVLEEHFTVCWWERRGAGLSYSANLSPHGVLDGSDLLAVTDLRIASSRRLPHPLRRHVLALQAVAHAQQLYHCLKNLSPRGGILSLHD